MSKAVCRSDHKHEYTKCCLVSSLDNPLWYIEGEYCKICGRQRLGEIQLNSRPPKEMEWVELEV